jgi:hypothetical protein
VQYYNSQLQYAAVIGVQAGALTPYVSDGDKARVYRGAKVLERLEETGLNLEWYLRGTGQMLIPENYRATTKRLRFKSKLAHPESQILEETNTEKKVNGEQLYRIPNQVQGILSNIKLHLMSVSAATGTLTSLNDLQHTYMPLAMGVNLEATVHEAIYVNGQSMEDAGITTGDIIIFEVHNTIPNYDCAIVGALNGMPILKHLHHTKHGTIQLQSYSKIAKDIILGNFEELVIFGIVKKVIKDYAPTARRND